MPFRSAIPLLFWLAYALLLGHDLLPHHHHDDGAIAHAGAASDGDDDHNTPESDWWFSHQHSPGLTVYQLNAPEQTPSWQVAATLNSLTWCFSGGVLPTALAVLWPHAQAKAPPGRLLFKSLRAPPSPLLV